jgi:hypothetical protein
MAGAPITLPAVPLPKVTKMPWAAGRVQELKDKAMQKAQEEAKTLEAGAGLSPEQTATVNANAANAGSLAAIQGKIKNYRTLYRTLNPSATEEEESKDVSAYASSLIPGNEQIGNWEVRGGSLDGQNYPLSYDKKRGMYKLPDGSISSTPPENWKESPKATGIAAEKLKEYADFIERNPNYEKNGGSIEKWTAEQTASGKGISWYAPTGQIAGGPNGRKYNAWDPDLPQDVKDMFKSQGAMMDKKQQDAMALAAARGASFAQNRIVIAQDKDDPASNVYIPAGLAYKLGFKAPSGAYYQAMEAMLKDATSGPIANEFTAFGTALQHADLLQKAALGLSNGDARLVNSITNDFSVAFGDPAVTNFDVIRGAYQRELTKALTTGHITDSEIAQNGLALPDNASPAQIQGALNGYRALMNSKIAVRIPQIQSALSKFGISTPFTPPGYVPPGGGNGTRKGSKSLAAAMALPINKGKSADEVQKHMESLGYIVTKP